jgi:hypothetical protein
LRVIDLCKCLGNVIAVEYYNRHVAIIIPKARILDFLILAIFDVSNILNYIDRKRGREREREILLNNCGKADL